ncbi:helix-turn-helix domain-containing protein, partial [Pseudoalteromonas sp. MMG012]|uniref:helix-turn-helix domain-containing protein n=1 Tax=Pseudoalteromonas sp. MMG012 TaxID=2822686 RepID=UPI001B3A2475
MRLLAVALFFEGENRTNIARRLNTARSSVNKWVSNYLESGLAGLDNKPISGRPANLTIQQQSAVKAFVLQHAKSTGGGRLIAADIQKYIIDNFNVKYQLGNVYRLLHSLELSWIT